MLNIPNKSHFKMNEVCGLTGVKPYVLRFWESEFEQIDPIVSSSGQKLYQHKDIEAVAFIKKLLFEDKLNVEEAKRELSLAHHHHSENDVESQEEQVLVSRQALSESDVNGLSEAKVHLRAILGKAKELQASYNWQ